MDPSRVAHRGPRMAYTRRPVMTQDDLAVLDLRIRRSEQGNIVEIRLGEREFPVGTLATGLVAAVTEVGPEAQGARLFTCFTADEHVRTAWNLAAAIAPRRRIRLRIDDDVPALHTLPWEAMRDDSPTASVREPAAARDTPFSRLVPSTREPLPRIDDGPLRVLTAVAAPADVGVYQLTPVDLVGETAVLAEAMALAPPDRVRHTALAGPCSLSGLEAALEAGYHVLHLVAHGVTRRDGEVALLLEGANGSIARVDGSDFAAMLERLAPTLRLVVLMACGSANRGALDVRIGLIPKLFTAGIPAVLAMQGLLPIKTGRAFTRAFYEALWSSGEVDRAANRARATLLTGRLHGSAMPVLYSALPHNRLLAVTDATVITPTLPVTGPLRIRLEDLLRECFHDEASEAIRFAARHYGRRLSSELPNRDVHVSVVVTELLEVLQRRGLFDEILFAKLLQHAPPPLARQIHEVARACGVTLPIRIAIFTAGPGRFPTLQSVTVVGAMVLCLFAKRASIAAASLWLVWVAIGVIVWFLLLCAPQQGSWIRKHLNDIAALLRRLTPIGLLEMARQELEHVYGCAALGRRALRRAAMVAFLGVSLAVACALLSPIEATQLLRVGVPAGAWLVFVLIVENTVCQALSLATTQHLLRIVIGRSRSPGALLAWGAAYLAITAALASFPALSFFMPPLPLVMGLDQVYPPLTEIFAGANQAQADLLGAHQYPYLLWSIALSTAVTACLPSLIVAYVLSMAATVHYRGGAVYRILSRALENLADLRQDIVQVLYTALTALAAFTTLWILT